MVVPRSARRHRRRAATDSDTNDRIPASTPASSASPASPTPRCEHRRSRTTWTRSVVGIGLIGVVSLLAGTLSTGALAQIRWSDRGLELSTGAAVLTGLVLFAGVAAAVLTLTGGSGRSGQGRRSAERDAEDDGADETESAAPAIFTGDVTEDTQIALVRDESGDWTWRVLHLETLAEHAFGVETRAAATARVERLQSTIDGAGLQEVSGAAIRLSATRDGAWRWTLVREDGTEIGVAATEYDDREAAEQAVGFLKDAGPEADVVTLERAAFAVAECDDRWRWQLVDDERTPLATSPDDYARRAAAEAAAERFAEGIADARVLDVETIGVELIPHEHEHGDGDESADGDRWTWRLVDGADEIVADATVAFADRPTAEEAALTALGHLDEAAVTVADEAAYERYPVSGTDCGSRSGSWPDTGSDHAVDPGENESGWQWRLIDATDRVVARAPALVGDRADAKRATELFRETVPDATVLEIEDAAYEVFPADGRGSGDGVTDADADSSSSPSETDATTSSGNRSITASDGGTAAVEAASEGGGWHWRLVTADRDVLAASTDSFADAETATAAIERVREGARGADVTAFETAAFRVYEDEAGDWRWRLLEAGGTVRADSDAAHDSRNEAIEAMLTLKERAPDAEVVEIDAAEFELFEAGDGWSWRLIDDAGRLVAAAPERYPSRDDARAAVARVCERLEAPTQTMDRAAFQPYADSDGETDGWRWRYVLPTGGTLAVSAAAYATRDELVDHLSAIREAAATDRAYATGPVTVHLRGGDAWRWRLLDRDREPIAESAGAYPDRESARSAVDALERVGADAPVFTIDDAAIRLERDAGNGAEDETEGEDGHEDDRWRWTLVDGDRTVLATAARSEAKADLEATIDEIRRLAPLAEPVAVTGASFDLVEESPEDTVGGTESESGSESERGSETKTEATDANWRWRLLDADGDPVAVGSSAAASKVASHETIGEVRSALEAATVIELEGAVFELYTADNPARSDDGNGDAGAGAWAWRLLDAHGETVLESTRTYESRAAARGAIGTLRSQLPDGRVTVADGDRYGVENGDGTGNGTEDGTGTGSG